MKVEQDVKLDPQSLNTIANAKPNQEPKLPLSPKEQHKIEILEQSKLIHETLNPPPHLYESLRSELKVGSGALASVHVLDDETAKRTGALCLDGSPPMLLHSPAKDQQDKNKWVIYLQGGGWCAREEDCLARAKLPVNTDLLQTFFEDGILSSDDSLNPVFSGYNRVFFRYCDGGSFAGDRDQPLNVNGTNLYFRGHKQKHHKISK